MPKYYPFGRKTILLDIFILDTTFIFLGEKNHMQESSIVEKTLNQSKYCIIHPTWSWYKNVISIHNRKMCKKTDVMYIPIFLCQKCKQIAKKYIPHTIKLLYTQTTDYPVWDNNNTSICYIHNKRGKVIMTTMDYPVCDNNKTSLCYIHNNVEK